MNTQVRRARLDDRGPMLELWERAVRATHHFLDETDIAALRPFVVDELASDALEWWVLVTSDGAPIGFLGFANDVIEALFIDPAWHGQGGGLRLVAHAASLADGPLSVEVNEQNPSALGFYKALGFAVESRSALDSAGRPFPILHMRRAAR